MLVLTRRVNQRIVFPTLGISVRIVKWAKGAARIGIEAPEAVPVLRRLRDAMQESLGGRASSN